MRSFLFVFLFCSLCSNFYGQWYKLPTQDADTCSYIETLTGQTSSGSLIFPQILQPVSDGHIIISSYYMNGPNSTYGVRSIIYETKDDFHSHKALYYSFDEIRGFYVRDDSSFSWHSGFSYWAGSHFTNIVTLNNFQNLDTFEICQSAQPYYPFVYGNCLTQHFIYSLEKGYYPGFPSDTLRFGKSLLSGNINTNCLKLPSYDYPWKMQFLNDSVGFISCCFKPNYIKRTVLKTTDFGQSWNPIYIDSVNSILNFKFTSENIGFALLSNNTLIKTSDGGASWLPIVTPTSNMTCFDFFDNNNGYIGGNQGFLSKTIDGSQTWNNEISGTSHQLKEIFALDNSVTYFKDSLSDLYKNTALLISVKELEKHEKWSVFPNPTNNKINIQSEKQKLGLVTIYNVFGEIVFELSVEENKLTIDLSTFPSGIYVLKIKNSSVKIIKY